MSKTIIEKRMSSCHEALAYLGSREGLDVHTFTPMYMERLFLWLELVSYWMQAVNLTIAPYDTF